MYWSSAVEMGGSICAVKSVYYSASFRELSFSITVHSLKLELAIARILSAIFYLAVVEKVELLRDLPQAMFLATTVEPSLKGHP